MKLQGYGSVMQGEALAIFDIHFKISILAFIPPDLTWELEI